ncbi:hypothetical protein [Hafnia phage yong3]|nr:hypothetical protein [Hafnia phage yong3]
MRTEFQRAYHALLQGVVTVEVKFPTTEKTYTYRALKSDNIEVGDTVVTELRGKFFTTDVVAVHNRPRFKNVEQIEYKWIVCKVDKDRYESFQKREALFEERMEDFMADRESKKVIQELVDTFGPEAAGYLSSIATGWVEPTCQDEPIDAEIDGLLRRVFGTDVQVVKLNDCAGLEDQLRQMLPQGQVTTSQYVSTPRSERVDLESRYNKHIQNMHTLGGMTWRDFMTYGADTLDTEAVRSAKILFDRFKRKQYQIEAYIEEFKNKS